jgi:hypothetical protein
MIVYLEVVYGVLLIVFIGRWTDRWRGRRLEKSMVERAPSGEIEDRLPSPEEVEYRLPLLREIVVRSSG